MYDVRACPSCVSETPLHAVRVRAQFLSAQNLDYLEGTLRAAVRRWTGPWLARPAAAADTPGLQRVVEGLMSDLPDSAAAFIRAGGPDPLAEPTAPGRVRRLPTAAPTFWGELRRLNRAFVESRLTEWRRLLPAALRWERERTGSRRVDPDGDEPVSYQLFVGANLRPAGYATGPGALERASQSREALGLAPTGARGALDDLGLVYDPARCDPWLGGPCPCGGPPDCGCGRQCPPRLLRYETFPFWQKRGRALPEPDLSASLGAGARELVALPSGWDMDASFAAPAPRAPGRPQRGATVVGYAPGTAPGPDWYEEPDPKNWGAPGGVCDRPGAPRAAR